MTIPGVQALAGPDQVLLLLAALVGVVLLMSLGFAAFTLVIHLVNDARVKRWRQMESEWEKPLLEVIDGDAPASSIHALISPRNARFFVGFVLQFDRVLGAEEHQILRDLARPYLPTLLPDVRRGSPERRARAVQTLARFGLPEYSGTVVQALNDPSIFVAMIAARGLFKREYPEHFAAVLSRLDRFSTWSRGYLVRMLAAGGGPAVPLLRDLMTDGDREPGLRAAAVDALREMNDLQAVERAADVLDGGLHPELAIACLRLLGHAGHGGHATLVRRYAEAHEPTVRAAALAALGTVGNDTDAALLREHVDDTSPWVALAATRALFSLAGPPGLVGLSGAGSRARTLAEQVLAEASWA
ncbi:MAG: HEAT repeat domain-containing protein [Gemmatimonadetes bacterium]|nr:HEAT repeat domain-containing protein [Gemmatimonadota bacterium]